jgi:aminomethyltransferase
MVDFAGWDMPVNYGSQMDEHREVRRSAGMFDVSHMQVVDIQGTDARPFLLRALANNVDKLRVRGAALYTCMLNPQGGVVDDLIVFYVSDTHYRLIVNAGTADKDVAWLAGLKDSFRLAVDVRGRAGLALIAVQGPQARERVWQVWPHARERTETLKPFNFTMVGEAMVSRTGYTGEDGFEVTLPAGQVESFWNGLAAVGVRPCGLGALDTLRLEAGMNLYGQDMDEVTSPLDAGLAWTVALSEDRDFIGKTALVSAGQQKQFLGLILQEQGGVLRSHQAVTTVHGVGELTSGTFSPTLSASIGLARLPLEVQVGDMVHVAIREKSLAAQVVKPPFVRNGKILVTRS